MAAAGLVAGIAVAQMAVAQMAVRKAAAEMAVAMVAVATAAEMAAGRNHDSLSRTRIPRSTARWDLERRPSHPGTRC